MTASEPDIQLFNETSSSLPISEGEVRQLTQIIARRENCAFRFLEIVFVEEEEIIRINKEHLERDYVTDIITFRYDEKEEDPAIEGTLFCCAPRIREQASTYNEPVKREFHRIVIHGLLHLAGYDDRSAATKRVMTEKEDAYLELSSFASG